MGFREDVPRPRHIDAAGTADRESIRDVLGTYARALDARDWIAVACCFTEDAQARYDGRSANGRLEIVNLVQVINGFRVTTHHLGRGWIEIDGDQAHASTPLIAYVLDNASPNTGGRPSTGRMRVRGIEYKDVLVRGEESWMIAEREHRAMWSITLSADVPENGLAIFPNEEL